MHFFSGKKKLNIFLDLLLEASKNGVELSDEEILEEVETFMFAVSGNFLQKPSIAVVNHLEFETQKN
jgi:hypothetical protein